ncbi:branched-chain amino acid ABC transporter permease [Geodermatophilus nigrescens]|uniref:Amino acid/amide ABC transporter membrane protein 1, HAAT family n=1 Tax=Geodermatophilus nigrescens TaxID=1070870 RepID=A0A1M5IS74_9ACTN|nr:branched-chain amino acid ABC transporter permease [Geodermatophilus nigrescens]SHG30820.1 amino acid/amide ABC transporter membrane protein 1, HAAT family [Geodermatophilus nigrescens]
MSWVNAVVQGVLLGGLYALVAAGLSLVFGVMRIVNLAHGVLAVVAAYGALVLGRALGLHPFLALLLVVPAMAAIGYLLQRGLLDRALRGGELAPLLVTFGLAIVLQNVLLEAFSADNQRLSVGALGTSGVRIADGLSIGWFPLLAALTGVAVIAGLGRFLARTRTGRAMRAASDDPEAARLMGVDDRRIYAVATALALATVAVAGVFLGARSTFDPAAGATTLIFAFEAVVIGGLGSLWGTLAGGIVLGVAQGLGAAVDPAYGVLAGHLVFLAVLAVKPRGLFPSAVTA